MKRFPRRFRFRSRRPRQAVPPTDRRRQLLLERLESRVMLAADVAANPMHNYDMPNDVDQDGQVSTLDALRLMNEVLSNGVYAVDPDSGDAAGSSSAPSSFLQTAPAAEPAESSMSYDVNNDMYVNEVDALLVMNAVMNEGVNVAPPVAADNVYDSFAENELISGNVITDVDATHGVDSDPDGDMLSIGTVVNDQGVGVPLGVETTLPSGSTLTIHADGSFTYELQADVAEGANFQDTFGYFLTDGSDTSNQATVTIDVTGIDLVRFSYSLVDASNNPIAGDTIGVGQPFKLVVSVEDTRIPEWQDGVQGAILDVNYTSGILTNDGTLELIDPPFNFASATRFHIDGQIGNGGGSIFTVDPMFPFPGIGGPDGVFRAPFTNSTAGVVTFTGAPRSDSAPGTGVFLRGPVGQGGETVAVSDIDYGSFTLTVVGFDAMDDTFDADADMVLAVAAPGVLANDTLGSGGSKMVGNPGSFTSDRGADVELNADGSFSYDPRFVSAFVQLPEGAPDTDTFSYTFSDGQGNTDMATVTINLTGANDPPVALDDTDATDEDTPSMGNVLDNDFDFDNGDTKSVAAPLPTVSALGATVTMATDGSYTYDPTTSATLQGLAVGESMMDTFSYTVRDAAGATDTATVTITVDGANDAPTAADVAGEADEDGDPVVLTFLGDDVDSDDEQMSLEYLASIPAEGAISDLGGGQFSFDPLDDFQDLAAGEQRVVSFMYQAADRHLEASNIADGSITVTGVNDAPTAGDVSGAATEDGGVVTLSFDADDIDSDDDPASLTYMVVTQPGEGMVSVTTGGEYTFDPQGDFQDLAAGETRDVTFTYKATDTHGADSNTATGTITVTGVNDDPTAQDVTGAATEDGPAVTLSFDADDIDSDDDPASLAYMILSQPSEGMVSVTSGGEYTFDPQGDFQDLAAGETRDVTFTYKATDSHGADSATATGTITVTGVNDDPTANDVAGAATEDGPAVTLSFDADDIDSDDNPTSLTYMVVMQPSEGMVSVTSGGEYTFDPQGDFQDLAAGETRDVTFTYKATDQHGADSATATGTITVTGVNDDPTAQDVTGAATEDGPAVTLNFDADDIDSDDDPASLTYMILSQPSEGMVSVTSGGEYTFDPQGDFQDLAAGETRDVTFTYKATDGHGADSNTATGTITVTGVNDDPVAEDVSGAAGEDAAVTLSLDADDVDSDDDPASLSYMILSQPADGMVTDLGGGAYRFDPQGDFQDLAAGETRDVTFTYKATDQHGADSNTATGTITVTGANDAPVAQDVTGGATEDGPAVTLNFDADDIDNDDDPASLTYMILSQPGEGMVSVTSGGQYTFDPQGDFQDLAVGETRDVTFTYKATDTHGADSNTATGTITVTGVNDDPTAVNDDVDVSNDVPVMPPGSVLDNDLDTDTNDPKQVVTTGTIVTAEGALVQMQADGTFTYDPNDKFDHVTVGNPDTDSFQYTMTDGTAQSTATVNVTVFANQPPVAVDDAYVGGNEDAVFEITDPAAGLIENLAGQDSDPESNALSVVVETIASTNGATVELFADGTFRYDPTSAAGVQSLAPGATLNDTFTYTLQDDRGGTDTATVTIEVSGLNDAPTAGDVSGAATEDGAAVTLSFDADDIDNDDDPTTLGYMILSQPSEGFVTDLGGGQYTFDPQGDFQDLAAGETRDVTFTYKATDTHGADSNTATGTITVTGVNDDPTAQDVTGAATEDGPAVTLSFDADDIDSDDDPASLAYMILSQPSEGMVSVTSGGEYTFDPQGDFQDLAAGETRDVTFTYKATDSHGADSATATGTITVTGVNDDPTANDVAGAATEDGPAVTLSFDADDIDSDDNPTSLTYMVVMQPSEGMVSVTSGGEYTFDPQGDFQDLAAGETRDVTFTYKATDQHGADSATATGTITVTGVNDDPTAQDVTGAATEDGPAVTLNFDADDIDSDDDPASLTYMILSQPSEGMVSVTSGGEYTFDPQGDFQDLAAGETRDVTFTYKATDGHGADSNTATGTITVTGVNDDPVAEDVSGAAGEDAAVTLSLDADDVDSDDDPASLSYMILSQPADGMVTDLGGGAYRFDPQGDFQDLAAGETRDVTFTYKATDGHGADSNTATGTITVTGANDAPVAQDVTGGATEDGPAVTLNFDADDIDNDDDPASLTYMILSQPGEGMVSVTSGGQYTFDPQGDFQDLAVGETRDVTFTYKATDTHGADSNTATGTITVTGVNDDPTAVNDENRTNKFNTVSGNVLTNDEDPDTNDVLVVTTTGTLTTSEGAEVTINADGSYTYDPANSTTIQALQPGEMLTDTFTYSISDGHDGTSMATVSIEVVAFIPSDLGGFVYFDTNNNGVFDPIEKPIADIRITLSGTDMFGMPVHQVQDTLADGSYAFLGLVPGDYTITQTQEAFLRDGKDTIGTQSGDASVNDQFAIALAEDTVGMNNNFGEWGLLDQYIDIRWYLTSPPTHGALISTDTGAGSMWSSMVGSWNDFRHVEATLSADLATVYVTAVDHAMNVFTTTVSTSDTSRFMWVGANGSTRLFQLIGSRDTFNLQLQPPPAAMSQGSGDGGEIAPSAAAFAVYAEVDDVPLDEVEPEETTAWDAAFAGVADDDYLTDLDHLFGGDDWNV